jgi:hypothetical protein
LSATESNRGQLRGAPGRRIPGYATGSLRLGVGRSQVQILSPRPHESPGNPGLSPFQDPGSSPRWGTIGEQILRRAAYGRRATHVRVWASLRDVGRLLRALARGRRPEPESSRRPGANARLGGWPHACASRASSAPARREGGRAPARRASAAVPDGRRGGRRVPRPDRARGSAAVPSAELRVHAAHPYRAGDRQAPRRDDHAEGRRASRARHARQAAGAEDRAQRHDAPALRLRGRGRERLGDDEPGDQGGASEASTRGRREPGSAVPHVARARRGDRGHARWSTAMRSDLSCVC